MTSIPHHDPQESTPEDPSTFHTQGLINKYQSTRKRRDLEELILDSKNIIALLDKDDPNRPKELITLGTWTGERYQFDGDITGLNQTIDLMREALQSPLLEASDRTEAQGNLARHLAERFDITKNLSDIEDAIDFTRIGLEASPEGDPFRASWLGNLGKQLASKYSHTGDESVLEEAIKVDRESIDAALAKDLWLNNLGNHLHLRFQQHGKIEDLEDAIDSLQQSLTLTPEGHGERFMRLANLASKMSERFSRLGAREDLDEAIRLTRHAAEGIEKEDPLRPGWYHNLGFELSKKYRITGDTKDLDEAIVCVREAIKTTPKVHSSMNQWLNMLSILLGQRFLRFGAMADIEEAVKAAHQAVDNTTERDPDYVRHLTTLGNRLRDKYTRTDSAEDLDGSISATKRALDATPRDHPSRPTLWNNLSIQLSARYSRNEGSDNERDIEDAVRYAGRAVKRAPDDHPSRAQWLSNLGFQQSVSIERYMDAASLSPGQVFKENLASLERRAKGYLGRKVEEGLDNAITATRMAVGATSAESPERAMMMINLGDQFTNRHKFLRDPKDLDKAARYYASAMKFQGAPIRIRLIAADRRLSAENILDDLERAYRIAEATVDLMPRLAPNFLSSTDKQQVLEQVVGLASNAASIALMASKGAACAIKMLETGRGILANSLQDLRWNSSLVDLNREHPELAKSYHRLRARLDRPAPTDELVSLLSDDVVHDTDERFEAVNEMDSLLREIRLKPAFERFLTPPSEQQLLEAAAEGPIAILNATTYRCDALVIDSRGTRDINLPKVSMKAILDRQQTLESFETLEWLWDAIVCPVLEDVGFLRTSHTETWPRIWWVPTGPLVRFPIHAAGYHRDSGARTVLDRAISSYALSVKSVISSRQNRGKDVATQMLSTSALLVSMENTSGFPKLNNAKKEIEEVQSVLEPMPLNCIQFPQPRRDEVLSALPACGIFHFAGHAQTMKDNPMASTIVLEDWREKPLTVKSIFETNLNEKLLFLAYLSACGTTQNQHDKSIDENIHLTSAFSLAGFRHVIGTLWAVEDKLCVRMAKLTYEFLATHGMSDENVSRALHFATRQLRDEAVGKAENNPEGPEPGPSSINHGHSVDGLKDPKPVSDDGKKRRNRRKKLRDERKPKWKKDGVSSTKNPSPSALWVQYVHYGS